MKLFFIGLFLLLSYLPVIGWLIGNTYLIQIHPSFAPMQYNTALCFYCLGLFFLSYHFNRIKLCKGLSFFVLALCFLSLFEYILDTSFGIDELIIDHYVVVETSNPGRMAPNTAICFILYSLVCFFSCFGKYVKSYRPLLFLALAGASTAFLGYTTDTYSGYRWLEFTSMAVHTSVLFLFLFAIAVVSLKKYIKIDNLEDLRHIILFLGLSISFSVYFGVSEYSKRYSLVTTLVLILVIFKFIKHLSNQDVTEEILRDKIDKLKEAKIKVSESYSLFDNAFTKSKAGMALVSKEGKWMRVNEALCEMLKYSSDELLKKSFQEITHEDDLGKGLDMVKKTINKEIKGFNQEKRYYDKDGNVVWVLLSVSPVLNLDDEFEYFICQMQDISEEKSHYKELEKANGDLKFFNRVIHHDLKSPLRVISGYASLSQRLISSNKEGMIEKVSEYNELIKGKCIDLAGIIEDASNFSKSGGYDYEMTNPLECLLKCLDNLKEDIKEKKVLLFFNVADFDFEVPFNKSALARIFQNLISNSIKYNSKSIALYCHRDKNCSRFYIKDDGVGIPEKHYDRLFEAFYRVNESVSGSGLGLAICRNILTFFGGDIYLSRNKGKGITFFFDIKNESISS